MNSIRILAHYYVLEMLRNGRSLAFSLVVMPLATPLLLTAVLGLLALVSTSQARHGDGLSKGGGVTFAVIGQLRPVELERMLRDEAGYRLVDSGAWTRGDTARALDSHELTFALEVTPHPGAPGSMTISLLYAKGRHYAVTAWKETVQRAVERYRVERQAARLAQAGLDAAAQEAVLHPITYTTEGLGETDAGLIYLLTLILWFYALTLPFQVIERLVVTGFLKEREHGNLIPLLTSCTGLQVVSARLMSLIALAVLGITANLIWLDFGFLVYGEAAEYFRSALDRLPAISRSVDLNEYDRYTAGLVSLWNELDLLDRGLVVLQSAVGLLALTSITLLFAVRSRDSAAMVSANALPFLVISMGPIVFQTWDISALPLAAVLPMNIFGTFSQIVEQELSPGQLMVVGSNVAACLAMLVLVGRWFAQPARVAA